MGSVARMESVAAPCCIWADCCWDEPLLLAEGSTETAKKIPVNSNRKWCFASFWDFFGPKRDRQSLCEEESLQCFQAQQRRYNYIENNVNLIMYIYIYIYYTYIYIELSTFIHIYIVGNRGLPWFMFFAFLVKKSSGIFIFYFWVKNKFRKFS